MTALPSNADFNTSTNTEGQVKTAITNLLAYLVGILGADGTLSTALDTLGALGGNYVAKTAAYTVQIADRGQVIDATTGTWTLSLPTVASAGAGFSLILRNSGAGVITIDPSGAELIDGAITLAIPAGQAALIICTGTAWVSQRMTAVQATTHAGYGITDRLQIGTAQATTGVTSIPFTGAPAWAQRATIMFNAVSTNGSSPIQLQIGPSGGIETTGYNGGATYYQSSNSGASSANSTAFLLAPSTVAAQAYSGLITICNMGSNTWVESGKLNSGSVSNTSDGAKTLAGVLSQLRITTVNGTDTFDAGSINIMWE